MSYDYDELEINPFYLALQDKYMHLFEKAQDCCHSICVPQTESFHPDLVSQDFVETHILKSSPYFKGQHMTTHSSNCKTLKMSDDGHVFTTLQGFSEEITVKILSEELAYNKDYKQYKILIVEGPFDTKFQITPALKEEQKEKELLTPKISISECTSFLKSFTELEMALDQLDSEISKFIHHYMILEDYLDDARARLEDISTASLQRMSTDIKTPFASDMKFVEVLAGCIESYLTHRTYNKVFPVITAHLCKSDKDLLSRCRLLTNIRPDQIGVRREFSCPLPKAVTELASMKMHHTPREKLACLKRTVDQMTDGVMTHVKSSRQAKLAGITTDDDGPCITSDDLIPILVVVIAQANCCNLHSDIFFMDNFIWDSLDRDRDDLSYCLVTFKAAVQYMTTTDFSSLDIKQRTDQQQDVLGIEDLMNSASLSTGGSSAADRASPSERLERRKHRLTGMLDQTTRDLTSSRDKGKEIHSIFPDQMLRQRSTRVEVPTAASVSKPKPKQNDSQLGDFLSALQDDEFDVSFGKQS